jgi:hypothetical protein
MAAKPIEVSCHCGAAKLEVARRPRRLTSCNCSICRRTGGLWAYYRSSEVRFKYRRRDVEAYVWGDRMLRLIRCKTCGCVLHWVARKRTPDDRLGVNMRNADPAVIAKVRVRRFDGAKTWKFLD